MHPTIPPRSNLKMEKLERRANAEVRALLVEAAEKLRAVLQDEPTMAETPMEVSVAMESAVHTIGLVQRRLESAESTTCKSAAPTGDGPTRQQGQFLAFIREYMLLNYAGVAPTHATLQRFFNLSAPSVNSMLIRLEQRGFIRRVAGKARAIELVIAPDRIPPLDGPFKF
jgi:hypothetical protein